MHAHALDWLHLIGRFVHIIAAIMWIGDSFLFMWLDSHLSKTDPARGGEGQMVGELWMVHSGGFYEVYKRKYLRSDEQPASLYWFKWESYTTWLSGAFLLLVVYYLGGGALLVDPAGPLSHGQAVAASLGLIALAWFFYDTVCRFSFAQRLPVMAALGVVAVAAVGAAYGAFLSGRAAYLHTGALFGTLMAANVFFRIIPSQRALLAATKAGTTPDVSLGVRAKLRSTHNHYMTLPLLITMLSNHFPATYGHRYAWVVLTLLAVLGVLVKRFMITRSAVTIGGALAVCAALVALTAPESSAAALPAPSGGERVAFAKVKTIIEARCSGCHAEKPTTPGFVAPPNGVVFDTPEHIRAHADRIKFRAVDTKTMPLGNMTGITDDERALLGQWVAEGASVAVGTPQ